MRQGRQSPPSSAATPPAAPFSLSSRDAPHSPRWRPALVCASLKSSRLVLPPRRWRRSRDPRKAGLSLVASRDPHSDFAGPRDAPAHCRWCLPCIRRKRGLQEHGRDVRRVDVAGSLAGGEEHGSRRVRPNTCNAVIAVLGSRARRMLVPFPREDCGVPRRACQTVLLPPESGRASPAASSQRALG